MMLGKIKDRLTTVRMRQQFVNGFFGASLGLVIGAVAGCTILVLQSAGIIALSPVAWLVAAGSTFLGMATGLAWPISWQASARLVDGTYDLKDRSLTAIEFSASGKEDELQDLQVEDALIHLKQVDATRVVPFRIPAPLVPGVLLLTVMFGIALVPSVEPEVVAAIEPLPVVLEQAELLEETLLEELQELAEEHDDEELEKLAEEIEETLKELKEPEVDQREALAKLSEMQQAIAEKQEQLSVEETDAQLEQLAEALQASEASQAASQAMKSQQYEKAAEELEKIDADSMSRKEKEAVKSNLGKLASKLGEGKKGQLSEAVMEMLEGLEKESNSKCKGGMCKAAGVCKKQGIRKKISECLNCQLNRLSECKSCCQGNCNKISDSKTVKKSNSPSQSAGMGASGQPYGVNKTKFDTTRRDESLTGVAGDGPSERETISTPEARQDAARAYSDRYAEFKKQMEEVIDSEPLSLGHRQTVRKYFESIRPENGDDVSGD